MPTTPVTSRFRLRLLFNAIRVVGCLSGPVWIDYRCVPFTVIGYHLWLNEPQSLKTDGTAITAHAPDEPYFMWRRAAVRLLWEITLLTYSVSEHRVCSADGLWLLSGKCRYADNASGIEVPPTASPQCHSRCRLSTEYQLVKKTTRPITVIGWRLRLNGSNRFIGICDVNFGLHGRDVLLCEVTASGATSSAADAFRRRAWRQPSTIFLSSSKKLGIPSAPSDSTLALCSLMSAVFTCT